MARNKVRCQTCGANNDLDDFRCRICFMALPRRPGPIASPAGRPAWNADTPAEQAMYTESAPTAPAEEAPVFSTPEPESAPAPPPPPPGAFQRAPIEPSDFRADAGISAGGPQRPSRRPPVMIVVGVLLLVAAAAALAVVLTSDDDEPEVAARDTTTTAAPDPHPDWSGFSDPSGTFAAEFPSEPAFSEELVDIGGGIFMPQKMWLSEDEDSGAAYAIIRLEMPAGILQLIDVQSLLLESAKNSFDPTAQVLSAEPTTIDGNAAVDIELQTPDGFYVLMHAIVEGDRIWIVLTASGEPLPEEQAYFLDNFIII